MEFHFFGLDTCILCCNQAKICPKEAGFSAFKLVMEKSLNLIAYFLCEPCFTFPDYFQYM